MVGAPPPPGGPTARGNRRRLLLLVASELLWSSRFTEGEDNRKRADETGTRHMTSPANKLTNQETRRVSSLRLYRRLSLQETQAGLNLHRPGLGQHAYPSTCAALTLEPPDLGGGSVALLVARGDAEDDGRLGGVVDVGVGQAGGRHQAGGGGPAVDPHEGQLGRTGTGSGRGLAGLDGQVHRVLGNLPRRGNGRLPGELGAVQVLRGADGTGEGPLGDTPPTLALPSLTLLILMAHGAPGKPGRHVLKADTSEKAPRPQMLMPATRNLYAVPGCSSTFFIWL